MQASGGLRLSQFDAYLLGENEPLQSNCRLYKLLWMKQVGVLDEPTNVIPSEAAGQCGDLGKQDATLLNTLLEREHSKRIGLPHGLNSPTWLIEMALGDESTLNVGPWIVFASYGKPLTIPLNDGCQNEWLNALGLVFRHADSEKHCEVMKGGVHPSQIDFTLPVMRRQSAC